MRHFVCILGFVFVFRSFGSLSPQLQNPGEFHGWTTLRRRKASKNDSKDWNPMLLLALHPRKSEDP